MTAREYTIGELAKAAAVTPRTIRFYTAEGLLPPPVVRGKFGFYTHEHLLRLRAIAALKEAFLPLSAIRAQLAALAPEELAALAAEDRSGRPSTASEYVRELMARRGLRGEVGFSVPPAAPADAAGSPRPQPQVRPRSTAVPRSETWERVVLADGLELLARLPLSPAARELRESILEFARSQGQEGQKEESDESR